MDATEWDERYLAADRLWSAEPNIYVHDRLKTATPGVGLDLAAGEGRNAAWLSGIGWKMTAIDFSSVAVQRGSEAVEGIEWVVADVLDWTPPTTYDLVLVAYLHLEPDVFETLVRRLPSWLSPGGEVFMIGHDVSNIEKGYGGPQVPEILWDAARLSEWLGGLVVVEEGVVRRPIETDEGTVYARDTLFRARVSPRTEPV
jgi:SAM-dependent methyltransferase